MLRPLLVVVAASSLAIIAACQQRESRDTPTTVEPTASPLPSSSVPTMPTSPSRGEGEPESTMPAPSDPALDAAEAPNAQRDAELEKEAEAQAKEVEADATEEAAPPTP